jgi:muramoyltetrapeptide carboxypeptidase
MTQYRPARALQDGDTIGFFTPSEWLGGDRPQQVQGGAAFLEQNGYRVQLSGNCLARDIIRGGTVAQRLDDISELVSNPEIRALLATWGGKACNHLTPYLPYQQIAEARKPVIGFSDVCVISNAITAETGLVTFYGPNIAGKLDESAWSDMACFKRSFDWSSTNILAGAADVGATCLRSGTTTGRLVGGNLNCFTIGVVLSKLDLSFFNGGIFFWEDLGLTPRQIDQFLTGLINVGFMDRISGMILGDFFAQEKREWQHSDPLESVLHALRDFTFPIIYAPTFGHRKLENPVFPIGAQCHFDSSRMILNAIDPVIE